MNLESEEEGAKPPPEARRSGRRRPARERLLQAADELLYREGLGAVGIDRLLEAANVAKATMYVNFRSKDELFDAYLQSRHERTLAALAEIEHSSDTVAEQIDAIFDYLADLNSDEAFRGCAFVLAAAELPAPDRPAMPWARKHKHAVREVFRRLFDNAGLDDPDGRADELAILYDGALITNVLRPEANAVERARKMAFRIIEIPTKRSSEPL